VELAEGIRHFGTRVQEEDRQLPARALDYPLVLDYKIDQLGLQGTYEGMILVDWWFYCPAMPETLINATKDFREGKIDKATHRARIAERECLAIRTRANPMLTVISVSCARRLVRHPRSAVSTSPRPRVATVRSGPASR